MLSRHICMGYFRGAGEILGLEFDEVAAHLRALCELYVKKYSLYLEKTQKKAYLEGINELKIRIYRTLRTKFEIDKKKRGGEGGL